MIQANELRIGNWYYEFGIPKQTDALMILKLSQVEAAGKIAIDVSPIPLTPEILEQCGFEKRTWGKWDAWDQYGDSYAKAHWDTNHVLHRSWEKEPDWCMGIECTDASEEINYKSEHFCWNLKYLHQLQNLYYTLTGQELTINP